MSATSGVAHLQGTRGIHFQVTGSGSTLLLIAGTGYPGATWLPEVVDSWATAFTVITYDHRGTGDSAGTNDEYTTRLFAGDAAQVITTVESGPAAVIGHSMGGRVAQWLSLDRPDLVSRLVLVGSGAGHRRGTEHSPGGVPIRTVLLLTELGYEGYIRDLQRRTFFTPEFAATSPSQVRWLGGRILGTPTCTRAVPKARRRPPESRYLEHAQSHRASDAGARGRPGRPRRRHRIARRPVPVPRRPYPLGDARDDPGCRSWAFLGEARFTTRLIGAWLVAYSERTGS